MGNDFKAHFKLDIDIKTNSENMEEILNIICGTVTEKFKENIKDKTEIEVYPTMIKIEQKRNLSIDVV